MDAARIKPSPLSGCLPHADSDAGIHRFHDDPQRHRTARRISWAADLTKTDDALRSGPDVYSLFQHAGRIAGQPVAASSAVAVMVWQAHMQPPSPGMDPSQQKMMRYILLCVLLFFYNYRQAWRFT